MLKDKAKAHLLKMEKIDHPINKIEQTMKDSLDIYPFRRASIFTYSPLTKIGQGLLLVNDEGTFSIKISEDIRFIPLINTILKQKKPEFVRLNQSSNVFPTRYIKQFSLTSLLIIPLRQQQITVGCVFIDRFEKEINDSLIYELDQYFQIVINHILEIKDPHPSKLSKRQLDALQLLANGYATKEIAAKMNISEFTARDYLTTVTRKLGAKHRTEAVAIAIREGIIT